MSQKSRSQPKINEKLKYWYIFEVSAWKQGINYSWPRMEVQTCLNQFKCAVFSGWLHFPDTALLHTGMRVCAAEPAHCPSSWNTKQEVLHALMHFLPFKASKCSTHILYFFFLCVCSHLTLSFCWKWPTLPNFHHKFSSAILFTLLFSSKDASARKKKPVFHTLQRASPF